MSYQFKQVNAQVAYRLANIVLTEDGGISATVTIGTLTKPEGQEENTFTQIAQQGYYLSKEDVDTVNLDSVSGNIRAIIETAVEIKLREKGSLTI